MINVDELAAQLSVDPGDIAVLLSELGQVPTIDPVPVVIADEIRCQLDPHCERTMPELYLG